MFVLTDVFPTRFGRTYHNSLLGFGYECSIFVSSADSQESVKFKNSVFEITHLPFRNRETFIRRLCF